MALLKENINNLIIDDLDKRNQNWTTIEDSLELKADKTYVDNKVKTDVPVGAKFTDTVYSHPASHPASMITGLPTSLPANGGNADTVGGFTVGVSVPANAEFTDTLYSHPTTAGNKHIPIGGAHGQILRYSASGTAIWGAENDTITTVNGKTGAITKADITALGIPAQDTVVDISGKADKTYVDDNLALKANATEVNESLELKADKVDVDYSLALKADIAYVNELALGGEGELDLSYKADKVYVDDSLELKADKTYVDNQDALKANATEVNESLELKADITYVDDSLELKADKIEVDASLELKADITYVDNKVQTDVPPGAVFTDTITTINGKTGAISKDDIVALGIPSQDTVYSHPTTHPASMITGLPTSLPADGGNADTVGGFTVGVNVPANAVFTDTDTVTTVNGKTGAISKADIVALGIPAQDTNTTYDEITTTEIDAGTASTLRTITGRRVKYILDKVQGWIGGLTKSDVGLSNVDNVKQATKVEFENHLEDGMAHGIGNKNTLLTTDKSTLVGAMNELFTNVSNGKQLVGGAITDVDDSIVIPADPTFDDLASAISGISTGKKWASGQVRVPAESYTVINVDFDIGAILAVGSSRLYWAFHVTSLLEGEIISGKHSSASAPTISNVGNRSFRFENTRVVGHDSTWIVYER